MPAEAAPAPAPVPAFAGAAPAPAPGAGLPAFAAAAKKGAPAPAPVALLPAAGASQAPAPAPEGAAAVTASLAAPAPAPSNPSCQTGLQGYLQSNPNLTLLTTALNGSTQVSVQNPFTFFAPLDTAFQYIPGDLGEGGCLCGGTGVLSASVLLDTASVLLAVACEHTPADLGLERSLVFEFRT